MGLARNQKGESHAILHVLRRVLEAEGNWGGKLTSTNGPEGSLGSPQEQHFVAVASLWGPQGTGASECTLRAESWVR